MCPNSVLMVIPLEVVAILSNKVEQGVENYEMTLLSAVLLEHRGQTIAMDIFKVHFLQHLPLH